MIQKARGKCGFNFVQITQRCWTNIVGALLIKDEKCLLIIYLKSGKMVHL